jgi:hypothetical protein
MRTRPKRQTRNPVERWALAMTSTVCLAPHLLRGLLAKSDAAARFIVDRGLLAEGGRARATNSADRSRFGVVVTQKLAAQAVPVIGALGGAAVNYRGENEIGNPPGAH